MSVKGLVQDAPDTVNIIIIPLSLPSGLSGPGSLLPSSGHLVSPSLVGNRNSRSLVPKGNKIQPAGGVCAQHSGRCMGIRSE